MQHRWILHFIFIRIWVCVFAQRASMAPLFPWIMCWKMVMLWKFFDGNLRDRPSGGSLSYARRAHAIVCGIFLVPSILLKRVRTPRRKLCLLHRNSVLCRKQSMQNGMLFVKESQCRLSMRSAASPRRAEKVLLFKE